MVDASDDRSAGGSFAREVLGVESVHGGQEQDGNLQGRCESERREKSPDECAMNAPF